MSEAVETRTEPATVDFGQALSSLLRTYLDGVRGAVEQLPGGPRGYQVMSVANGDACSNQATIAERLGLDRTVMTYLVDDLEKAGLVERRPDPADRRARQVVLTAKGSTTYDASSKHVAEVERAVLAALPEADAELFRQLLMRIASGPGVESTASCEVPGDTAC
jgi:DNA-binding MarR family transcriptional regulator